MENLSVGGNPLMQLEEKLVEHRTKFTWLFIIMAVVILILVIVVIWLAATRPSDAPAPVPTTQGFNSSFNQVDYSGITGNTSTNETGYNKFAERLVPSNIGAQGFDADPRNALQKRYDSNFEGGRF